MTAFVGPNGQGKTNLVEAAAYLATQGSHRVAGDAPLVRNGATRDELEALKAAGIVGVAWNVTHYGVAHYDDAAGLLDRLAALDLFVDVQVRRR